MQQGFSYLNSLLPASDKNVTRAVILERAAQLIRSQGEALQKLSKELDLAQAEIADLKGRGEMACGINCLQLQIPIS